MALELREAIAIMESGEWFSCRFITADVNKGTGGKVIELAKARILRGELKKKTSVPGKHAADDSRDARHSFNVTRNLELQNKQIRKVHPILITHINNQPVL